MFKTESKGCTGCIYRYDPNLVVITYENLTQFSCNISAGVQPSLQYQQHQCKATDMEKYDQWTFIFLPALCRVRQKSKGGITACIASKQANIF